METNTQEANINVEHDSICLYHANCVDGAIAAALLYRAKQGKVECIPVRYQEDPPLEKMYNKKVYLVDFTYPPEVLLPHVRHFHSLVILDHHEDAVSPWLPYDWTTDVLAIENVHVMFDNAESGATLTWKYFYDVPGKNATMPLLVEYAREYDIWTKRIPMTDEVQSALRFRFPPHKAQLKELGDFLFAATEEDIWSMQKQGEMLLGPERNLAQSLIRRHLQFVDFLEYKNVALCMMPPELANMAGEMIYTQYPDVPFVAMFEDNYPKKTRKYCFRSRRDGGANVSRVAAQLGGKGHYNSAGAMVSFDLAFQIK